MKKFFKKILAYIWTPFNRDSLWNCCLRSEYCTYRPERAKLGMIFCHVDDDTHKHRVDIGVELRVVTVMNGHTFILEIPYITSLPDDPVIYSFILVSTLKDHLLNKGDVFNVYGQYKLDGYMTINGSGGCMKLVQINDKNEHVFKEPFIDFGFGDR